MTAVVDDARAASSIQGGLLMGRVQAAGCLTASFIALAAIGSASAARSGSAAPPDVATLALAPSDVPGSLVAFNGPLTLHGVSAYVTVLLPNGGRSSSLVENVLSLRQDDSEAAAMVTQVAESARSKAGRLALGKSWAKEMRALIASPSIRKQLRLRGNATVSKVTVGRGSTPAAGVLVLPVTASGSWGTVRMTIGYVQVDRAFDAVELLSVNGASVARSALTPLIAKVRARLLAGFTVANVSPPTIAGDPTQGPLTVDTGDWSGGATDFGYLWQRCPADASSCTTIEGATQPTYTPAAADNGSTFRVVVTASNSVSSQQATSTQTSTMP